MRHLLIICILLVANLCSHSEPLKKMYTVKGYYIPNYILTRYPYSCNDVKRNRYVYYEKRITQEELGNIQSNLGRLELIEKNMAINNYRQVIEIIAGDKCILTICFDADAVISVNDRFYLYDDEVYNYFFLDYNEK